MHEYVYEELEVLDVVFPRFATFVLRWNYHLLVHTRLRKESSNHGLRIAVSEREYPLNLLRQGAHIQ